MRDVTLVILNSLRIKYHIRRPLIYFTPLGGNVSHDYMDFRAGHITTCWALSATISQLKVRYMYGFKNSFVTIC